MPQWNLVIYFWPENGAKTNISELPMFFFFLLRYYFPPTNCDRNRNYKAPAALDYWLCGEVTIE